MPSPPWVAPEEPSAAMVNEVRGVSWPSWWPGSCAGCALAENEPVRTEPATSAAVVVVTSTARRIGKGIGVAFDWGLTLEGARRR